MMLKVIFRVKSLNIWKLKIHKFLNFILFFELYLIIHLCLFIMYLFISIIILFIILIFLFLNLMIIFFYFFNLSLFYIFIIIFYIIIIIIDYYKNYQFNLKYWLVNVKSIFFYFNIYYSLIYYYFKNI